MRKIAVILTILFCCIQAQARMNLTVGGGGVPAAPAGPAISDDFSSDTSANYTTIDRGITITGGAAQSGGTEWQEGGVYHETDLSSANHYVQAVIEWTTNDDYCGLLINVTPGATPDTTATGYVVRPLNTGFQLIEFSGGDVPGSWAADFTNAGSVTWTTGDRHLVKASSNGSGTITIYVDWNNDLDFADANETAGTLSDATYSGTFIGLFWQNDGTENFIDDLAADAN